VEARLAGAAHPRTLDRREIMDGQSWTLRRPMVKDLTCTVELDHASGLSVRAQLFLTTPNPLILVPGRWRRHAARCFQRDITSDKPRKGGFEPNPLLGATAPLVPRGSSPALPFSQGSGQSRQVRVDSVGAGTSPRSPSSKLADDQMLQLLWFDPKSVRRIRRQPAWEKLLDELAQVPHDAALDDEVLDDETVKVEDHRDVFDIVTHGDAQSPHRPDDLLHAGLHEGGRFVPPLILVAGILCFSFDPVEDLRVTMGVALPFAAADQELARAIESAKAFTEGGAAAPNAKVCGAIIKRITEALRRVESGNAQGYLEDQRRSTLLEQRSYQTRRVFDSEHVFAMLRVSGESTQEIPTYLPTSIAYRLPLFERFPVRLIASVEPPVSQFEQHTVALRALALGRVSRRPR
jgi:hypothetical protein